MDMVFLFSSLVAYMSQTMHSCDVHNIDTSPIQYTPLTYVTLILSTYTVLLYVHLLPIDKTLTHTFSLLV